VKFRSGAIIRSPLSSEQRLRQTSATLAVITFRYVAEIWKQEELPKTKPKTQRGYKLCLKNLYGSHEDQAMSYREASMSTTARSCPLVPPAPRAVAAAQPPCSRYRGFGFAALALLLAPIGEHRAFQCLLGLLEKFQRQAEITSFTPLLA
jgi:hypothetical protein